jgi:hypothetical protein
MKENEYIELVKSHLQDCGIKYFVKSENFHGPHWSIIIESNSYTAKVYGDIGFDIEISNEEEKFSLWKIDRNLIDKTKTSHLNIKTQLNSLIKLIEP